ncbi:AAA family ATPase [Bacteroides sp. UBA939]|uniref:AAA family ATPase n=1 Tax=Bacteroides sp. UBA939 TaxID=1946092 RepID=UPI0025BC5748|nr:AAA family ATPase [Bacteroides sp. UBA939]
MKLRKLTINNFRCFEEFEIEFASHITVLIGKNGAGKSSLIHAIHNALSFIFTRDSSMDTELIVEGNPSLKVANIATNEIYYNNTTRSYADYMSIKAQAILANNENIEWELYKRSVSNSLFPSKYKDAYVRFIEQYKQNDVLPVFAYYSDSYPHINTRIGSFAKGILSSFKAIPRNFGYYQWGEEASCTAIWQIRFLDCWVNSIPLLAMRNKLEAESAKGNAVDESNYKSIDLFLEPLQREMSFINNRLIEFSKEDESEGSAGFEVEGLQGDYRGQEPVLVIKRKNGDLIPFENLPAGYKRLFSIVFDTAYRAYILNGEVEPTGIVVIDEIDLHLHPTLEQSVLQRLNRTFPQIQFIVSSHSALVITNLNANNGRSGSIVLRMNENKAFPVELPNMFGVDYNTTISDVMQTPARNGELKELIDDYIVLKVQGYEEEAKAVFEEIQALMGNNEADIARIEKEIEKEIESNS